MALTASVVVCAYTLDRWDLLVRALDGALRQEPRPAEVVLVVDHNPELAEQARHELTDRPVVVTENRSQPGLSGARNTGLAVACDELVAFLDDDARPAFGWLSALLAAFDDPRVVAAGGTARPEWARGRPAWFPPEFDWVVGCSYRGQVVGPPDVRNPLGCNMAFRRRAAARVGGFRSGIGRIGRQPLGCEETELCIRLRQTQPDARIVLVPEAVVHHRVSPERHRFTYFRQRCFAEGISKAAVSERVGTTDALSAERAYVTRTLPRGVVRDLSRVVAERDWAGARRAAAMVAGLTFTAAGYARGRIRLHARRDCVRAG
jgi:GT2 family glycosyltransferase